MRAAFTSIFRKDDVLGEFCYLPSTLDSMFRQDENVATNLQIKVFMDATHAPDLPSRVEVECRTQAELDEIQAEGLINFRNQVRALRWVSEGQPDNALVMTFEDDIDFAENWLQKAVGLAFSIKDDEFVFLLHHFHSSMALEDFEPVAWYQDRSMWLANKTTYMWGAQAVMLTAGLARKIADAMEEGVAAGKTLGEKLAWGIADQGINHYCQSFTGHELDCTYQGQGKANVYAAYPCLVNHVGGISGWDHDHTRGGASPTKNFQP